MLQVNHPHFAIFCIACLTRYLCDYKRLSHKKIVQRSKICAENQDHDKLDKLRESTLKQLCLTEVQSEHNYKKIKKCIAQEVC